MKKQVLYIHGGDSYSNYDNFLQYLRTKTIRDLPETEMKSIWTTTITDSLGEDFAVFRPSMPNKQNAKYEEWKIWLERHFEYLSDEVVLVGWSLGGMFLAKYLSENEFSVKIKALFLLAAPGGEIEPDQTGNDCGSFRFSMETMSNVSKQVSDINIWHSKDDFVVPYDQFLEYKAVLPDANFVSFEDKNHFLIPEFPDLMTSIKASF